MRKGYLTARLRAEDLDFLESNPCHGTSFHYRKCLKTKTKVRNDRRSPCGSSTP